MTESIPTRAGALWRRARRFDAVWVFVAAFPPLIVALDPAQAGGVLESSLRSFLGTLPYIAFAVMLIGLLKAAGAEGTLAEVFRGRESRMIVLAAFLGGLAPFCSCEVIPFIAALLAAGTPLSAVMAFWLSSPVMDPPQFMITLGALGIGFAAMKVVFAVMLGLIGGFAIQAAVSCGLFTAPLRAGKAHGSGCGTGRLGRPVWRFWPHPDRRAAFREAAVHNALFLTKWLSLAYLLEGLMIHYVPAGFIAGIVGGPGISPIMIGAVVGAPAYLNGYAAPALVSGFMEQGMSPGAAMAFMIGGSVTSIPAMAAVFALVARPIFGMYLALGIGGAILSGLIFAAVN